MTVLQVAATSAIEECISEYENRIQLIIDDTNRHIAELEAKVNDLVAERDNNWQQNLEELWSENDELREKLKKIKAKRKELKRWQEDKL
jgi:phage host-nuclease inhibitor protein Gam